MEIQYRNNQKIIKDNGKVMINTTCGYTYRYAERRYVKTRIRKPWFKPYGFTII